MKSQSRPVVQELDLAVSPSRTRWVAAALGCLVAAIVAALERAPGTVVGLGLGAGVFSALMYSLQSFARKQLWIDDKELCLRRRGWGKYREEQRLLHDGCVHVSADRVGGSHGHSHHWTMQVRVVGERGRVDWLVHGQNTAASEVERATEALLAAGVHVTDGAALRGSIAVEVTGPKTVYSWQAMPPELDLVRAALLLLGCVLGLAALFTLGKLAGLGGWQAVPLGSLVFVLSLLWLRVSRRRAWLEVEDGSWYFAREGLTGTHFAQGGVAMMPSKVRALRGPLPLERALTLRERAGGPGVLERSELSAAEMRWLAENVADSIELPRVDRAA